MGSMKNRRLGPTKYAAAAAAAGLAFSAVVGLPVMAFAGSSQLFDVWNLSAGPLVLGYKSPPLPGMPNDGTKIPTGKNLQISLNVGTYVIVLLLGVKPINQGQRPQEWQIAMNADRSDVSIRCTVNGDPKQPPVAACGNYIGNNVAIVADGQPGSKTTVPASYAQAQAIVVNNLCGNPWPQALRISCSYSGIQQTPLQSGYHMPPGRKQD